MRLAKATLFVLVVLTLLTRCTSPSYYGSLSPSSPPTSRPQYPSWRPQSSPLHLWTTATVPTYRVPDGSGLAIPDGSERVIDMIPSGTKLQVILVAKGNWVQVTWGDRDGTNQVRWINTGSGGVVTTIPSPISASPSPSPITQTPLAPSRTTEAQKTATVPSAQSLDGENISLAKKGGVYQLPVEINGVLTLYFVLDTGAADVNIPADVALTLHRTETIRDTDFLPGKTYTLADGSTLNSARFLLRSLKIGNRRVTNVAASIGPVSSPLLLGQSFLEKLGVWGIDSQRQVLTISTQRQRKEPTPRQTPPSTFPNSLEGPQVAVGVYPPRPVAPQTVRNSIGMEFALVPAGTFQMGANDFSRGAETMPVHTVRITQPFYLGKYKVTQGQWQAVMGNNPSHSTGDPNRPVESVSWDDVQEFIRTLNTTEGGTKYRLPTEAEWEYAARAGSTSPEIVGDDVHQFQQCGPWGCDKIHPVWQLRPIAWGLHDMYDDVFEWAWDWYGPYPSGTVTDPLGPTSGSHRVIRGCWTVNARYCPSFIRNKNAPHKRIIYLGFRLLRVAP